MGKEVGVIIGIVVGIGLLLMVILLPLSLKRVGFDEVAIKYDKVSRKLGDELLREGLHDIGPSGSLIKFQTTQREINFNRFNCLTKDGLELELSLQISYSIDITKEDILAVIDDYGNQDGHDQYLSALSASIIRDVSVRFDANTYYSQREDFEKALQTEVESQFITNNVHAALNFVQVVNIELPRAIENSLLATITAFQDIDNANTERGEAVQAAEIRVELAAANAEITILNAEREAGKIDQETEQSVLVERNRMQLRAYAFGNISQGLGKGGDFFVNSYLRSLVLQENTGKTIVGL